MRVIQTYPLPPGCCFRCKSSMRTGEVAIDFSVDVDLFGSIYMCQSCLTEAGALIGLAPVVEKEPDYLDLALRIEQLEEQLATAESTVAAVQQAVGITVPEDTNA